MSDDIYPTLLDTETGETREASEFKGWFWWAEGNGSCDCNRAIVFDKEDEMEERFADEGLPDGCGACFGATRFIAIDVHGDLGHNTKAQILEDFNRDYPEELVRRHVQL